MGRNSPSAFHRLLIFAILSILLQMASAQTVDVQFWVPNGTVNSISRINKSVYVGGSFSYVGPSTGYGAEVDLFTGSPNMSMAKVNGPITSVVSDRNGGWYIGGYFKGLGVARETISHT